MKELERLSELIHSKNKITGEIAEIIGRPALVQHVVEYIAGRIFNIQLETSATAKGIDGRFTEGTLANSTVNIKWHGKQKGLMNIGVKNLPDFYLVMTGPKSPPGSSRGKKIPWIISYVFLFESRYLVENLKNRGVKIGIATSVASEYWKKAQIYPVQENRTFIISDEQMRKLQLFGG